MFLPLDRKPDWKNPPLVTLLLVLINVLFFYIWQYSDEERQAEAFENYVYSGLFEIEAKEYLNFRNLQTRLTERDYQRFTPRAQDVFQDMYEDAAFQRKLDANEIITPDNKSYNEWRQKRDRFSWLWDRVVINKYGLNPSDPTLTTLFTHMFLHGDSWHLFGNMIFLFLMGFVVEIILGRLVYFAGYIVAGLISGLTYVLLFHDQNGVGIGASGAIAGIMGMYLVLFGLRKIRFFYFLFVYFDYVKAPAIVILPFYILTQLFIEFAQDTNINVTAHLGGLLGGVVIGLVAKRFHKTMNTDYIDENVNLEQYQQEYEEAQRLLASTQIDEAREKFESLLKKYPADTNIKQQLFVVSKYNPASEPYHRYAHELLRLTGSDKITVKIIHDTFIDYAARAKPRPRWTPDLLISIAVKFAACGYLDDAEKLVNYLIKAKRDYQRNAEGLSALVKYFNGIDKNKMARYQKLLLELYPDSAEAFHVR